MKVFVGDTLVARYNLKAEIRVERMNLPRAFLKLSRAAVRLKEEARKAPPAPKAEKPEESSGLQIR